MRLNNEKVPKGASIEDEMLSDGLSVHCLIARNARITIVALGVLSLPLFALLLIALAGR